MNISKINKVKLKQKLINWSLFLFIMIVGIYFLELANRRIMPQYYLGNQLRFMVDEDLFIRGMKDTKWKHTSASGEYDVSVRFNEFGFRDSKILLQASKKDYFALGDSYTFGWGVEEEDRFANLIQNDSTKVYNIASPNDFAGYRNVLDHFDYQIIAIQKLIVGVCMENDLQLYQSTDRLPPTMILPDSSLWWATKKWLKYHSSLYVFITTQLKSVRSLRKVMHSAGIVAKHRYTNKYEQLDSTIESSARFLNNIIRGYKPLILIIPSRYLWSQDEEVAEKEAYLHHNFVDRLKGYGLTVIDLKPIMEKIGDPLQFHYSIDGHWNQKGHELAAETIQTYLSDTAND